MFFLKKISKPLEIVQETEQRKIGPCEEALNKIFMNPKAKGGAIKLYLENFKLFNDTFGYEYGEQFIAHVKKFLLSLPGVEVFRFGVEFIILLEKQNYTHLTDISQLILERFDNPWRISDMDYMCSMNLGAVLYPETAHSGAEVLKCLDQAIVAATQRGQNQFVLFGGELKDKITRRLAIAQLLKKCLHDGNVEIRFRPTFNMEKRRFTRAECYMRLMSPEYGMIGATEFVPIAEDSGQICTLNRIAIRRVCGFIHKWIEDGLEFESIAVSVSPVQFIQEHFLDDMKDMMDQYEIPPHKLAFELTESVLINSLNTITIIMQQLSDLGIEFILNEFGTGYSGINNILDIPVDVLKLERMFVWQLETNPRSGYVIEGLIQIAHRLGLKLIAEGVETENQVALLNSFGCGYEQGFYYSPTVTAEELEALFL